MTGPARFAIGAAAAALAVGIVGLPATVALASTLLVVAAIARSRHRAIAVGALLVCVRLVLAGAAPAPEPLPTGSGPWFAVVESVGSTRDGTRPAVVVLELPAEVRLAATLPWYPEVAPGDRVRISGSAEPAPPDGDYAAYLSRLGASGSIRASSLELVPLDTPGAWPTWDALRAAAAKGLERSLPEPEAGLAAGILVGLRDRVDRDLAAAFTTAGVSHIVAISGWNIAIVATTLGALTGRLGRRRRTVATGLAILAYVAFVGPSPSVVRAGAMAGCALLARELGRPTGAMSAMGLAVAGLLLLDPGNVGDPGFQLSVLATAGLITWGTGLSRRLAGPAPGRVRAWLAESLGVSLAAQAATLPAILLDFGRLSLVSPAVNLAVAPLVAPGMAAGGAALLGGLVALSGGPAGLATIAGLPAWALLGLLIAVVRLGAGLPFASVMLEPPWNGSAAALAAAALVVIVRGRSPIQRLVAGWRPTKGTGSAASGPTSPARAGRSSRPISPARASPSAAHAAARSTGAGVRSRTDRTRRAIALAIGAATLAVGIAAAHRPDGTTRVTILDVGQGDAVLVEGGAGSRLLVDGGPDPGRLLIALDERLPPWDRRIDVVVLTHPHEDHVAGLALLLTRYRVARVFEPGMLGPGPGYAAWEAALERGGPTRWALGTGDRLSVDGVSLIALWPDRGTVPLHPSDGGTAINNVSIVLLGDVAGRRFLLTGDIEQGVDPQLLDRGLPKVDLLKVAHHGSATATTQALLDAIRPDLAVISVGAGNPYGHPASDTVTRLRETARRVLRTDIDGSVTVTFGASGTMARAATAQRRAANVGTPSATVRPANPELAASTLESGGRESGGPDRHLPATLRHPAPAAWPLSSPRYHRRDDSPVAGGGGAPAPLARSARLARAARSRRRRDRWLAGAARRAAPTGRGGLGGPRPPP